MEEENERPVWKSVLSILVTIFLVVKLIYTCSHKTNTIDNTKNQLVNFQIDSQKDKEQYKNALNKISNNFLYYNYESLDSLSSSVKENYRVLKLEKDSLVYISLSTKIKIPKDYYFQNNHDDSLRIAFKSPENLTIFIHDFDSKEEIEKNFKILKADSNLQNYKASTIGDFKVISYKISKNKKRYNGYALCIKGKELQTFFEFESDKLSSDKLRSAAILFLSKNMK
jgi:hypothetical protein